MITKINHCIQHRLAACHCHCTCWGWKNWNVLPSRQNLRTSLSEA